VDYYGKKDEMRRSAQADQAARFNSTAKLPPAVSSEVEGAPGAGTMMGGGGEPSMPTKKGAGGYEYAEMGDGSYKIVKSPTGNVGTVVKPGMRGYDAIKAEMTGQPMPAPAAEPAAPKPAVPMPERQGMGLPVTPGEIRDVSRQIAESRNPMAMQMRAEAQGPQIRGQYADKLRAGFQFLGGPPEMAKSNAEALLAQYEQTGRPEVLEAIKSLSALGAR
jgi:hypothetical protein